MVRLWVLVFESAPPPPEKSLLARAVGFGGFGGFGGVRPTDQEGGFVRQRDSSYTLKW